jgi:hypothetical protein
MAGRTDEVILNSTTNGQLSLIVMPASAGIQVFLNRATQTKMDAGRRRHDGLVYQPIVGVVIHPPEVHDRINDRTK